MRISSECRGPDLLAAEVRRLQAVIDAGEPCPYVTGTVTRYCTLTPFTLTDREREAIEWCMGWCEGLHTQNHATLQGLRDRMCPANGE